VSAYAPDHTAAAQAASITRSIFIAFTVLSEVGAEQSDETPTPGRPIIRNFGGIASDRDPNPVQPLDLVRGHNLP
jgi:hypothetical protein